ncbi:phosphoribosylanthranilate isomerase [Desulfofustis glycolicus DSM 9705]|uniref:N-(5'-phosphoribosyl)anthranilate isomerase n=2 Tax=Desulfofustis glycolicus TaxID=51195 RepID=A0A1M5Y2Y0_9BACT|nr:phosphoribosylanthranilate isomerase [Desulfofustis glycolicus DSM 9705]
MCGTTREEDARAAIAAGVDGLGFIFVAASPRQVTPDQAAKLIETLPPFIARVGVFRDADEEEIKYLVDYCGLTQVQLHGNETPAFCRRLRSWRRGLSVSKAVRIGPAAELVDFQAFHDAVDSIMLDTYVRGAAGGTGRSFDWSVVPSLGISRPIILAGGLHAGNVVAAIEAVRPYAIDINSGVEAAPGRKDHALLHQLVTTVRRLEQFAGALRSSENSTDPPV